MQRLTDTENRKSDSQSSEEWLQYNDIESRNLTIQDLLNLGHIVMWVFLQIEVSILYTVDVYKSKNQFQN